MVFNTVIKNQKISYFVEKSNAKNIVLFIHGFNSSKQIINKLLKLPNRSYKFFALDLPGFGKSKLVGLPSIEMYRSIIEIFINKIIDKPVILMGHSLGCYVSMALNKVEKVIKIILISPSNPLLPLNENFIYKTLLPNTVEQAKTSYVNLVDNIKIYGDSLPTLAQHFYQNAPIIKERFLSLLKNEILNPKFLISFNNKYYQNLKKEVLIIHGYNDRLINYKDIQILSKRLNAQLFLLKNCGHSPIFEHPEIVNNRINYFCK